MPSTILLTTEFLGEFLKWKSCDPFLHHTQCIIGQLSYKLREDTITSEEDKIKTAVNIANSWESWFLHLEREFPNISFFIEVQEFVKRDLFAFGIPENQELIWKEIPIILENIRFLIQSIDCFLFNQHFPEDIISIVRYRNYPVIIESANKFLQQYTES